MLLDTIVLSELVRPRPDSRIQAFVRAQTDPLISALTIHEIAFGAEPVGDPSRRAKLIAWVAAIQSQFAGRIVDVDATIAEQAGRAWAHAAAQGVSTDPINALIAACAIAPGGHCRHAKRPGVRAARRESRRALGDIGAEDPPKRSGGHR